MVSGSETEHGMSDEAPEKSGRVWLYVVGVLLGLPLCYVLSSGPMVVLALRGVIPKPAIETAYNPLEWFTHKTGTVEAVQAYIVAWCKVTGTPIR
ncbi:MAG: hypothetical protein ABMA26_19735 [Limisphaerales bacterium]